MIRTDKSQGRFHVKRRLDGAVLVQCPPVMVVPPCVAIDMAKALLTEAGVDIVLAEPGQTVIRPPKQEIRS